jgi:hypothetical protein
MREEQRTFGFGGHRAVPPPSNGAKEPRFIPHGAAGGKLGPGFRIHRTLRADAITGRLKLCSRTLTFAETAAARGKFCTTG